MNFRKILFILTNIGFVDSFYINRKHPSVYNQIYYNQYNDPSHNYCNYDDIDCSCDCYLFDTIDNENIYKCTCDLKLKIRINTSECNDYDECILNGNDGCMAHLF